MAENAFYVKLKNRGLVTITGPDHLEFLQGLVTNNIDKLATQSSIYACLLTPQGKFLHDFFMIKDGSTLLLDCEGGERAKDLHRRLSMYRLRADVKLSLKEDNDVYAVFGTEYESPDTRHPDMGYRAFEKPDLPEKPFETWDHQRIELTIPDGSRDLIPEKSTMDEGNMDQLSAIDYDKGCYVGQELTARMHYRGLGKKKLQTVKLDNLPENAELRSSYNDIGIALVKN